MSPPIKRHLELEIKIPENAAKDAYKLRATFESNAKTEGKINVR